MTRPVRPVALVVLTACALYPGLTFVFQGLYPIVTGEWFMLRGQYGPWADLLIRLHLPHVVGDVLKSLIGFAWLAGVPGLWAGDARAYWLAAVPAALLTLFYPGGPMVMAVIALICLFGFRENAEEVPA
jgi:hypothetical protein